MLKALRYIGWFVAIAYISFAIFDLLFVNDPLGNRAIVFALLAGGGVLVVLGLRTLSRNPWPAAGMISIGAVMGAFPVFWSILAPLLAISLVVRSVLSARRLSATPT